MLSKFKPITIRNVYGLGLLDAAARDHHPVWAAVTDPVACMPYVKFKP